VTPNVVYPQIFADLGQNDPHPRPRSQLEQRRADAGRYGKSGTEPTLDEMLREPAIRLIMKWDNVIFTVDGRPPHFPSASDHFPDVQTNLVPINESMGAYNAYQQSDVHSYWEFNYLGTNWIHPLCPGPSGEQQKPQLVGDNPNLPRDPDKFEGDVDAQREFR
jgi:hypothetical protein